MTKYKLLKLLAYLEDNTEIKVKVLVNNRGFVTEHKTEIVGAEISKERWCLINLKEVKY